MKTSMHIITRKRLNLFAERYPECRAALAHWYRLIKGERFASFAELRKVFPQAEQVGRLTVFNSGDDKVRLTPSTRTGDKFTLGTF